MDDRPNVRVKPHVCLLPVVQSTMSNNRLWTCPPCGQTYRLHPIVRRWFTYHPEGS